MQVTEIRNEILRLVDHVNDGKSVTFSALDQFQPRYYTNFIYGFRNDTGTNKINVETLKESLLKTLIEYPEFTGTFYYKAKELILEYTNNGVQFITATANLNTIDIEELEFDQLATSFLPDTFGKQLSAEDALLVIKVTTLLDKSVVMSVSLHHAICDAHGMFWFMNAWASVNKYGHIGKFVNVTDRKLLSGDDSSCITEHEGYRISGEPFHFMYNSELVRKQFDIKATTLEGIKSKFLQNKTNKNVTYLSSHDIISTMFWRAVVKAKGLSGESEAVFGTIVEGRRMSGLNDTYIGNCLFPLVKVLTVNALLQEYTSADIACKIREMVSSCDKGFVESNLNFLQCVEDRRTITPGVDCSRNGFFVSSWAKFPIYQMDFGSGVPWKFYIPSNAYSILYLSPNLSGDGFIGSLVLKPTEMDNLLENDELLTILHN